MNRNKTLRLSAELLRSLADHAEMNDVPVEITVQSARVIAELLEELMERRPNLRLVR